MAEQDYTIILALFGLGYLLTKYKAPIAKTVEYGRAAYGHYTGTAHQAEDISRIMGGPHGFRGTSLTWPRFFPAISEWLKL